MRTVVERNIVANYVGTAWSAIIQIAFVPLYIRYLGIETYGLIGVYASLLVMLSILDVGMTPTLNREMARFKAGTHSVDESRSLLRTLEVIYFGVMAAICLSAFTVAPWLATHWLHSSGLSEAKVGEAVSLMGLLIAFRWLTGLYRGAIMGLQHQIWLNAEGVIFSTLRSAGVVPAMIWIGPTIRVFFVYQALVTMVEAVVLFGKAWRLVPSQSKAVFRASALQRIWRFSAGVTVITLLSLLLMQSDKALLSKILSLRNFGYYALASSVAGSLSALIAPISNVAFPRFSELVARGDKTALIDSYHRFSQMLSLMLIPGSAVLALFSAHILVLWTRDAVITNAVAPLVSLLVVGTALNGLMYTPYNIQLAYGRTKFMIAVNAVCVIAFMPALYFGVKTYGAIAAGYTWAGLNACYVAVAVPLMHRTLLRGEQWRWYTADVALPLLGTLLVVIPCYFMAPPAGAVRLPEGIAVVGLTYLGALVGAALLCPTGRELMRRISNEALSYRRGL